MANLSFLFVALGALLALARQVFVSRGRVRLIELFSILTITLVAFASLLDIFVGPVGDARSYHQTINACFASLPPCGSKLHEQLWSVFSASIGPGWGLIYGFSIAYGISCLARAQLSWRSPVLTLLFFYSAYQIGNGMAEGTFFLLLLVGVIAAQALRTNIAMLALLASFVGHLGNAPFVLYILGFPRKWTLLAVIGIGVIFAIYVFEFRLESLFSFVGKAQALASDELMYSALENKTRVSIRDADTSYASILLGFGFPFSALGLIMSLWFYLFPVVIGGNVINLVVSMLSSLMTIASFRLAKGSYILFFITLFSILIFAPATFAPGIGLRHKVPVFLFLLMARNPTRLRQFVFH